MCEKPKSKGVTTWEVGCVDALMGSLRSQARVGVEGKERLSESERYPIRLMIELRIFSGARAVGVLNSGTASVVHLRRTTSSSLSLVLAAGGLGAISLKTVPSLKTVEEEEVRVTMLSELFPGDEMDGDDKGVLKSSVSSCEKAGERRLS